MKIVFTYWSGSPSPYFLDAPEVPPADAVAPQTGGVVFGLLSFFKPSDDVRQVCEIILDNFKHFLDTPGYKFITVDFGSSSHFPTDGATSDNLILDRGTATIESTFVYTK